MCHGIDQTDAAGVIGLAESLGGPRSIFGGAAPEVDQTFEQLRGAAHHVLGERSWPRIFGYRIRLGVK